MLSFPSDGVVTVTVEGDTIITYNDPDPLGVNYLGFGTVYNDIQYYFNCTKAANDDAIDTVTSHTRNDYRNSSDRSSGAPTTAKNDDTVTSHASFYYKNSSSLSSSSNEKWAGVYCNNSHEMSGGK